MAKKKLKWVNKYSGESGYVKTIRASKGYFENGTLEEAKIFRYNSECNKAIETLGRIGEAENNDFVITDEAGVSIQ